MSSHLQALEQQLVKQAAIITQQREVITILKQRAGVSDEQIFALQQVVELDAKNIRRLQEEAEVAKAVSVYE